MKLKEEVTNGKSKSPHYQLKQTNRITPTAHIEGVAMVKIKKLMN